MTTINLTTQELLNLVFTDDSLYQHRYWLVRNTTALGWCKVIPEAIARQIQLADPHGIDTRIQIYEVDGLRIYTLWTPASWKESDEPRRLAGLRHLQDTTIKNGRDTCEFIARYAANILKTQCFLDEEIPRLSFYNFAAANNYSIPLLVAHLDRLGFHLKKDLVPHEHVRTNTTTSSVTTITTVTTFTTQESCAPEQTQSDASKGGSETSSQSNGGPEESTDSANESGRAGTVCK